MCFRALSIRFIAIMALLGAFIFPIGHAKAANNVEFSATGFESSYEPQIQTPTQAGDFFIVSETLISKSATNLGTDMIFCRVTGTTAAGAHKFLCAATFNLGSGDSLQATFAFNSNQTSYDAKVIRGTGKYARAAGVIHVTDPGPGKPTGYEFDLKLR